MIQATTWIGSIPSWALLAVALAAAWRVTKGGGGSAVSELSRANEVLTNRVHELGGEVRDLRVENAELKGRTDVTLALTPLLEWSGNHEQRAQDRHDQTMVILSLVAKGLGQEPNGHGHEELAA
jgi:hypothetical protein